MLWKRLAVLASLVTPVVLLLIDTNIICYSLFLLIILSGWVSEWLMFSTNWVIRLLLYDKNKLPLARWCSCLLFTRPPVLIWICVVLPHWNNSLQVDRAHHEDTIYWLRTNQSCLLLLNTACLVISLFCVFYRVFPYVSGLSVINCPFCFLVYYINTEWQRTKPKQKTED